MAEIDILLALYNGEKYIETQLLSIVSQSYKDWRLLIHDDGSTDDSIAIVKRWAAIDGRIQLVEDGVKTGGAANNFMHLLKYSTARYIMFCDQDDIWLDNKVQLMHHAMSQLRQDVPQVVYSNSYVWKPDEGILGKATLTFPRDLRSFLFLNSGMQGCVAMFNEQVRTLMLRWQGGTLAMHDHLLHLIGLSLGQVSYMPECLMLYRKHDKNVTGGTKTRILNQESLMKNAKVPVVSRVHYEAVKSFVEQYGTWLNNEDLHCLHVYLSLSQKSCLGRLLSVLRYRFKIYDSILLLVAKMLVRPYIG